jgi:nicotinamide phosphoribosyltransferase
MDNIILATDSYKLTHWNMYNHGTERIYSYLESRGGPYPATLFFGLQYILKRYLEGTVVTRDKIEEAASLCDSHFSSDLFNRRGWERILNVHGGKLPIEIKAVREGAVVPVKNVLMTIENTDEQLPWLTNALESLLLHVWYPTTVATVSYYVKNTFLRYGVSNPNFMLHDFGYRGASSNESAAIGGAAHLLNFLGTDTLPAMLLLRDYYGSSLDGLAFSVAASEHSVMTLDGPDFEHRLVERLIYRYPNQILSLVADSYNIYEFVKFCTSEHVTHALKTNSVKLVIRPDSITNEHKTPAELVVWILKTLEESLRLQCVHDSSGRVLLPNHYRVLWGDGIDPEGINQILSSVVSAGYSPDNLVFGMGGGLLQKVNRDTCKFAIKCSAAKVDGQWRDVQKNPLDSTKKSKAGKLELYQEWSGNWETAEQYKYSPHNYSYDEVDPMLQTVFRNGVVTKQYTFDEVRDV